LETLKTLDQLEQARITHSVSLLKNIYNCLDLAHQKTLYEQAANLEASHISEVLAGETRTKFEFDSREGKLYALQPEGVTDWEHLHQNGVYRATLMARENPGFEFYARIAEAELEEARAQEAMVKRGVPSTMLAISLCGNDVASPQNLRLVGRDPELQKGYLRAGVFDGHKMHLYSYSKDNFTLEEARQILRRLGVNVQPDANSIDILRARPQLPGAQHDLLEKLVPPQSTDAYKFVLEQSDLLDVHMSGLDYLAQQNMPDDILAEQTNQLRYNIMSSFKQRLEGSWIDLGDIQDSVAYAGDIEREAGTQFAGCDVIITTQSDDPLVKSGYLNALLLSGRENWVWTDGFCKVKECPTRDPKPKRVKVGPCSVCKACQTLFDQNKDPSREYRRFKATRSPKT
jgi:hypothetical protein